MKSLLIILAIAISSYIYFLKTEKYESSSTVIVKDLSEKQSTSPLGALLTGASGVSQDAMLLDVYIKSSDMFELLDKEFKLRDYYSGTEIDMYNRLYDDIFLTCREINGINLLERYNSDLKLFFDEPSSTLSIKFAHADAEVAQQIVISIM